MRKLLARITKPLKFTGIFWNLITKRNRILINKNNTDKLRPNKLKITVDAYVAKEINKNNIFEIKP